MEKDKIFVVIEYGGCYEDSWENARAAFDNYENAKKYVDDMNRIYSSVDDETYEKISDMIAEEENKIHVKYFGEDYSEYLLPNMSRDDFNKELDDFYDNGKYDLVKEKFGIDREVYMIVEENRLSDFSGYMIQEIDMFRASSKDDKPDRTNSLP